MSESTIHIYRDTAGRKIRVVTPWGDHSGNIPPPYIEFSTGSFAYQGSQPAKDTDE